MTESFAEPARVAYTFCRYCPAACGLKVTVQGNRVTKIVPDKRNPHSWRDFCGKGRTANRLVEHPRRITAPMRRVGDRYVEASWDEAIADIAARMNAAIARGGPDAVGVYYGNPAGFSSSNLVFMNGWLDGIGTNNRYAVGSVDQNSVHVVAEAMYGSTLMVLTSDIDRCDYFLLVGANPAVSAWNWLESAPGGWGRAQRRRRDGATVVVVDPVRTVSADDADIHLAVRPGQDWALLLAMVAIILDEGLDDRSAHADLVTGFPQLRELVAEADLADLAARCDIPLDRIREVARGFAAAPRAMVVTRTGLSLHAAGTIAEWLGHVLNVITGRIDQPGGRRFEPGYIDTLRLADLAGGAPHLSRVAGRGMVAGAHALAELPAEITTPGRGQIRAMLINSGNPVVSGPDGAALDAALAELDLLVVVDFVQRESHRHAHWLLPAVHWLERDDLLALTSGLHDQPYVQFGAQVVRPPEQAREEWRIFLDLALAMRAPLFGARGVNTFMRATRAAARLLRKPGIAFGPHWIHRLMIATSRKYDGKRVTWRKVTENPHGLILGPREYGHFRAALRTPDKRIALAPPQFLARTRELLARRPSAPSPEFPFLLGNQRRRHSMNSWLNELPGLHNSGKSNDIAIHPDDAAALGIATGDTVRVYSPTASIELRARLDDRPRRGVVIIDHGWGSRIFDPHGQQPPLSYGANRNLLVDATDLDPLSQTSALNAVHVNVEPLPSRAPTVGTR
ncbi:molybdopterin-containing oxidoreductase family protein [Nocardia bovistercoris]|uniref:Molybdopterin-dependent oxidoreductase n=1 Tax=Nocardia bovistercoris TaxID=2785916 RepID=A0A931IBA1_9NOCA|nr:molybdopterin-dependent oxidoreductase [Nocardia bovistercoris]MBH0777881.1 molybdopterin-dependent oxidoreductase [Nocardia bovistercoris]